MTGTSKCFSIERFGRVAENSLLKLARSNAVLSAGEAVLCALRITLQRGSLRGAWSDGSARAGIRLLQFGREDAALIALRRAYRRGGRSLELLVPLLRLALRLDPATAAQIGSEPGDQAAAMILEGLRVAAAGDRPQASAICSRLLSQLAEAEEISAEHVQAALEFALDVRCGGMFVAQLGPRLERERAPEIQYLLALALRETGEYRRSLMVIEAASGGGVEGAGAVLRRILTGDLSVYQSGTRPQVTLKAQRSVTGRILHVLGATLPLRRSGYTYRADQILRAQLELGLSPAAVTTPGFGYAFAGVGGRLQSDQDGDLPVFRLSVPDGAEARGYPLDQYLQWYAEGIAEAAQRVEAEIVHAATSFVNGIAAAAAAKALGVPFVYEVRGLWEDTQVADGLVTESSDRYRWNRELETECMREAHAVIALSAVQAEEIAARGIPAAKIFVVPNAVEDALHRPQSRDVELAEQLDLADSGQVVGYVGSMSQYEGLPLLMRAFARLGRGSDIKLLLVGDGEDLSELTRLAAALGIEERVILPGRVSAAEAARYLTLIDIYVIPRLPFRVCQYVSPIKPIEAMGAGKILVTSDLPIFRELLADGDRGTLVPANEMQALSEVLSTILADPSAYRRKAERGHAWVLKERTWEKVSRGYLEAYAYARGSMSRGKEDEPPLVAVL